MIRTKRLLLTIVLTAWFGMVLACGGAGQQADQGNRAGTHRGGDGAQVGLVGQWTCISEVSGGEPVKPGYHKSWTVTDDRLPINGDRKLWYSVDASATPTRLEVYNRVGDRKVVVYSCIFKFDGDKLIICFNPGDDPPKDFRADRSNTSFLLTFTK